jgi:hypothetical protein
MRKMQERKKPFPTFSDGPTDQARTYSISFRGALLFPTKPYNIKSDPFETAISTLRSIALSL